MAVCVCLQEKFRKINLLTFSKRLRILSTVVYEKFLTTSKRLPASINTSGIMTCASIFLPQSIASRRVITFAASCKKRLQFGTGRSTTVDTMPVGAMPSAAFSARLTHRATFSLYSTNKEPMMPIRNFADEENFVVQRATIARSDCEQLQSLATLMPPQLRQQFLKKLFRSDAARFDKLLLQLEAARDWVAAHRLIEAHFYRHQINPYQNDATRFSDLVYKRYFPQDEYIA